MNNDSSSSAAAADLPALSSEPNDSATETIVPAPEDAKTAGQKRLHAQTHKKNELLAHLLENLDSIIYMELAVLYYMEYESLSYLPFLFF